MFARSAVLTVKLAVETPGVSGALPPCASTLANRMPPYPVARLYQPNVLRKSADSETNAT
jgi:hypothetical protein